jgi:hypothetical protein
MFTKTLSKLTFTILALTCAIGIGWTQSLGQPLTVYKLNSQIIKENDPVWALLKEDSTAGKVGRFGAQIGSGVELARSGYRRRLGRLDFHVRESDMPEGGQGVRSSIDFRLLNHLKLDLRNDSSLGDPSSPTQSANIVFQIKI